MANKPGAYEANTAPYDSWLLGLFEDPIDTVYTSALRAAKDAARAREQARKAAQDAASRAAGRAGSAVKGVVGQGITAPGMASDAAQDAAGAVPTIASTAIGVAPTAQAELAAEIADLVNNAAGKNPAETVKKIAELVKKATPATPKPGTKTADAMLPPAERKLRDLERRQHKEVKGQAAMLKGMPVSETDIFGDPANPGAAPDPYVEKWVRDAELGLDPTSSAVATKSGNWIYVGDVADEAGGPGYTRPQYVFFEEAKSGLAGMSTDQIKAYQKQLGVPESGIASGELQTIWDNAVEQGQKYAQQGKRVELRLIFESMLADRIAAKSGGGGGQYADETPQDMAGAVYYQAMMQILGDTSGVDSAQAGS